MKKLFLKLNRFSLLAIGIVLLFPAIIFVSEVILNSNLYTYHKLKTEFWLYLTINTISIFAFYINYREKFRLKPKWDNYLSILVVNLSVIYLLNALIYIFNLVLMKGIFSTYHNIYVFFLLLVLLLQYTPKLDIQKEKSFKGILNEVLIHILKRPHLLFISFFFTGIVSLVNETFVYIITTTIIIIYTYVVKVFISLVN